MGDEGFLWSNILLTPIRQERVLEEKQTRYNNLDHKSTRIAVEHTFGIPKKISGSFVPIEMSQNVQCASTNCSSSSSSQHCDS